MEWRDTGVIISVRKHGESSAIVNVLCENHGLHAGVIRGGASRKMSPNLQLGTQVDVEWRARLEQHLGSYRLEPTGSRAAILSDRLGLSALTTICDIVHFTFPERMHLPRLYHRTVQLLDQINERSAWLSDYVLWETALLEELGYGLELEQCVATGQQDDLIYVSPKSGCAVSKNAGEKWADKMLPLPKFLREKTATNGPQEILAGLKTTGYFLERRLAPAIGHRPLPDARNRFIKLLQKTITQRN